MTLQTSLNVRLTKIPAGTVKEKLNAFKSIVYKVSKEEIGFEVRKHTKTNSTETA